MYAVRSVLNRVSVDIRISSEKGKFCIISHFVRSRKMRKFSLFSRKFALSVLKKKGNFRKKEMRKFRKNMRKYREKRTFFFEKCENFEIGQVHN